MEMLAMQGEPLPLQPYLCRRATYKELRDWRSSSCEIAAVRARRLLAGASVLQAAVAEAAGWLALCKTLARLDPINWHCVGGFTNKKLERHRVRSTRRR